MQRVRECVCSWWCVFSIDYGVILVVKPTYKRLQGTFFTNVSTSFRTKGIVNHQPAKHCGTGLARRVGGDEEVVACYKQVPVKHSRGGVSRTLDQVACFPVCVCVEFFYIGIWVLTQK